MGNIDKEIENMMNIAAQNMKSADNLKKLQEIYPDLDKYTGRWNKVTYFSKMVNSEANTFDLRHNCGCCRDSPLELWPYLETPYGKVYSSPPTFRIGENSEGGDVEYPGWEEKLRNESINEVIINKVKAYFGANKPYNEDDEESDEVDDDS